VQVLDQFSVVSNEVARTLLGSLNEIRTSSPCFPFEVSKTTKSGLDDVIEVDVDSGNTREQIATSPTEIAVLNARLRDRFTQLVRVTWPRRLLCFADSSDVVWMSWDGYASENEVSSNTHLGCYNMAMVSCGEEVVYFNYCENVRPTYYNVEAETACRERALKRLLGYLQKGRVTTRTINNSTQ
jgi:hypothetical protein